MGIRADEVVLGNIRLLIFGPPKTRKTWKACQAAESGYNVLLFDGDKGATIIRQLSPEAQRRIRVISCYDKLGRPMFGEMMIRFSKGQPVYWNATDNEFVVPGMTPIVPEKSYVFLDATRLTTNDLVVCDSRTALAASVVWKFLSENNIDISEAKKLEWDVYGYASRMLSWMLSQWKCFDGHFIEISHEQTIDVTKKEMSGKDRQGNPKITSVPVGTQKIIPISSSKAHAETVAHAYTDVGWFYQRGQQVYITTKNEEGRIGGGRSLFMDEPWDNVHFLNFVRAIGAPEPDGTDEMPACIELTGGQLIAYFESLKIATHAVASAGVVNGTEQGNTGISLKLGK